jgi:hypothetical protein
MVSALEISGHYVYCSTVLHVYPALRLHKVPYPGHTAWPRESTTGLIYEMTWLAQIHIVFAVPAEKGDG